MDRSLKSAWHVGYVNTIKGNLIGLNSIGENLIGLPDQEKLEWEIPNTRLDLDRLKYDRVSDVSR